jgi:hypothetical protein
MNDEFDGSDKLVALMRSAAAVQDAPPAAFDHSDVLATSHRITRRHRMIAAGATGLVLIAGLGTAAVLPMLQNGGGNSTSVAEAPRTPTPPPAAAPEPTQGEQFAPPPAVSGTAASATPGQAAPGPVSAPAQEPAPAPLEAPQPGGDAEPPAASGGDGATEAPAIGGGEPPTKGGGHDDEPRNEPRPPPAQGGGVGPPAADCGSQQDPGLRAIVDGVVPEAAGAPAAPVTQSCLPNGGKAVHVEITKGGATGILTVVFSPKGGSAPSGATATTASGGTVGVSVRSTGDGPAPYADEVGRLASELASRL